MAIRPSGKKKDVIEKIYQAIQEGKIKDVNQADVILVTDPEILSLYDFMDMFYHIGKAMESIFNYLKSREK